MGLQVSGVIEVDDIRGRESWLNRCPLVWEASSMITLTHQNPLFRRVPYKSQSKVHKKNLQKKVGFGRLR